MPFGLEVDDDSSNEYPDGLNDVSEYVYDGRSDVHVVVAVVVACVAETVTVPVTVP